MSTVGDVYKVSLKAHRTRVKKLLRDSEKCYNSLVNKDSEYARAIKALQDLHRQVYEIYEKASDEIPQKAP